LFWRVAGDQVKANTFYDFVRTYHAGTVALSDRKRTTPQNFRPGDGRRTHCANTTPSSDGQDGRLSAQCDSQPEDLLRRDDVDAQCNSADDHGDVLVTAAGVPSGLVLATTEPSSHLACGH